MLVKDIPTESYSSLNFPLYHNLMHTYGVFATISRFVFYYIVMISCVNFARALKNEEKQSLQQNGCGYRWL